MRARLLAGGRWIYVTAGLFGVAECSPTAALGAADAARRRARLPYGVEKKVSKHRGELGTGAIEGVAGPEAAHNAAVAALWPSGPAGVMLAAAVASATPAVSALVRRTATRSV